ncbi:MAG: SIS domain-containing protein [Verrucomicrobiota bacterium]
MKQWISEYLRAQKAAHDSIPVDLVAELIGLLKSAFRENRRIFVFGNGGSASNASHFATDLGKGASDKINGKHRFQVQALNDNISWMTALANDNSYDEVFSGQLRNYGAPGDLVLGISVSGNSPNCVKAFEWAKSHGLRTVALVGAKRGRMAELADTVLVINDTHYGRVEDAQMTICHILCYAFMEHPDWA